MSTRVIATATFANAVLYRAQTTVTCVQSWHTHALRSARCRKMTRPHGSRGTTHKCQHTHAAEQHCTRGGSTFTEGLASAARGITQGRERACKGGTLTPCNRTGVASRHGRMAVAAQRTHASIRMQLSGSAQDMGAHALRAWWMPHKAERKSARACNVVDADHRTESQKGGGSESRRCEADELSTRPVGRAASALLTEPIHRP